jgi:hypothetical protein
MGISLGASQWLVIRKHFDRSWLWIIISSVGWAVAWIVYDIIIFDAIILRINNRGPLDLVQPPFSKPAEFAIWGSIGIIYGLITGFLLAYLLWNKNQNRLLEAP